MQSSAADRAHKAAAIVERLTSECAQLEREDRVFNGNFKRQLKMIERMATDRTRLWASEEAMLNMQWSLAMRSNIEETKAKAEELRRKTLLAKQSTAILEERAKSLEEFIREDDQTKALLLRLSPTES